MQRRGERLFQGAHDKAAHEAGIAKAHLGLGGMNVDVDEAGIAADEQCHGGMAPGRQHVDVGGAHGAQQQLVLHGSAVDVEVERTGIAAVPRRQAGKAIERDTLARRRHRQRVRTEIATEHLGQPLQQAVGAGAAGGMVEAGGVGRGQRETHLRMRHGEPAQHVGDGAGLGLVALEEGEPRRRRREEIAHLDAGAGRLRPGPHLALAAGIDLQHVAGLGACGPRGDGEQRHRGDGGQRLATEAERTDAGEIAVRKFGGGVALHRQFEVGGIHAGAVVDNADQSASASLDGHLDAPRAGVERVLDQLLHRRGRPLHHLAGGDAVDQHAVEPADRHGIGTFLASGSRIPSAPSVACHSPAAKQSQQVDRIRWNKS